MKNYGNTLLGYFKSGLDRNHCSIKYFNREFLAIFISEYNDSKKNGVANYEKTKTTRFYNENGCSYCVISGTMERIQARHGTRKSIWILITANAHKAFCFVCIHGY